MPVEALTLRDVSRDGRTQKRDGRTDGRKDGRVDRRQGRPTDGQRLTETQTKPITDGQNHAGTEGGTDVNKPPKNNFNRKCGLVWAGVWGAGLGVGVWGQGFGSTQFAACPDAPAQGARVMTHPHVHCILLSYVPVLTHIIKHIYSHRRCEK